MVLKRAFVSALSLLVLAALWAGSPAKSKAALHRAESVVMGPSSSYIEVAIDDNSGQFSMGVPGGGPVLIYGHPSPGTSFSTVRVDGQDYTNDYSAFQGSVIQAPTNAGNTNEGIWQIGTTALRVHQKITLVTSTTTGLQDTYLIEYKIDNNDAVSHTVGMRVMLDTKIGDNDNAPFQVPGTGSISNETQWSGASVPPYFFVFDDLYNPTTTCQGTLLGGQVATAPDLFQVVDWSGITSFPFDYTVTPSLTIEDTAYAPYWVNRVVAPGASITFGTYYGLGSVAVNTTPPLATALTAPSTLDCINSQLSPNPFTASLYLSNTLPGAAGTVSGVTATLTLPSGLSLASGTLTKNLGDVALGASLLTSWDIQASGAVTGTLSYSILVSSASQGSKTVTGQVTVPSGCVQQGCGTYVVTADNENNAHSGTPDGDWFTCVWNSDSNHPIEFNVPVTGALPASSAKLLLLCNDVDETQGEVDEVYLNGHLLGTLTGANNQDSTTLFTIPNLSWVLPGNNLVEIHVDVNDSGWCVYMKQAQMVIDGGCPATATCRSLTTDAGTYAFGDTVAATTEVDTTLASQSVRLETNILDPGNVNVAGGDVTFTATGSANDAQTINLALPSSGTSGVYTVESLIFDTATNQLQATCTQLIYVGSGGGTCPASLLVNQVDTSACPAVTAVVTVLDATGAPVTGLTTPNFCLKEDGAAVSSFTVTPASSSGSDLFLALNIDNSGSLGSTAFGNEKTAAKALIAMLGATDQAAVYGFTSSVDLVADFTADKAALNAAIDAYSYKGGSTAFYDSVYQSLGNTALRSGRKAVVAMTDGEDNSSGHTQAELIAYAQSLGIPVFTIGFGSFDTTVLQAIATQTGGKFYSSADSSSLQQILQSIGTLVNSQYVVTWTTAKTDGQSHGLEICATVPGCTTVTGQGSFRCGQGGGACPTLTLNQVDTSSCPTVKVAVTVTSSTGQPVTGLTASNFCLTEDGTAQSFTLSSGSAAGNLFVALNIDNTGSLGSTAFGDEKTAAKAFVALLGASDQAAIYGFTSSVDLVQDFTSDKATLNAAIDGYPYKGGSTAFYDSVYQSLSNTALRSGRKAVLAMTDGEDNASRHTQAELIAYAQGLGIPVFTIGFGSADQLVLSTIATQTGGRFYAGASSSDLLQILSDIGAVITSQYVLTYTTARADGLSHALDVCLNYTGCATQHAQGSMTCGASGTCPTLRLAQVDASSCPTVKGIVSVTNAQGQPITGLTAANFCVNEDGAAITNFTVTTASSSGTALYVALNIDNTGSLGSTAFGDEKTAAKAFVALLGASDQAAVYGFTSSVDLVQDFTSDKATLNAAIDGYPYKGGSTAFYDSVWQSLTNTATKAGRKAILAMTDGEDNSSSHSKDQLIAYAQGLGIPVYTIGFGSADQTVLSEISTQTGGKFYPSASSANLSQILTDIGNAINQQYVISYTTTKNDGSPHGLDICVTYGACTVHAQGSFQCAPSGACPTLTLAQVDTSSCPQVQSVVTVLDATGQPVGGLTAADFCLSEDGFPQPFTVTTAGQSGSGLYVAINIDNSGSLGSTQFNLEKSAAKTFVSLVGASDQLAVYGFTSTVDLVIDFTADKNALNAAIDAYPYKGGSTAVFDSIYQSLANTDARTGRKAVIAMTDGEDNSSSHTKADIITYAQNLRIPVYTIGFGSPDEPTLQEIATQTGGKYYLGTDAGALQQILTDIANLINNQYVITYTTTYTDGSVHDLDLCVTYQGCTVHARGIVQCGTPCAVTCTAQAQTSASTNVPAAFYGSAVPTGCGTGSIGYEWNFGDGTALSNLQAPFHAYAATGTYTWTLTATYPGSAPCTKSGTITVTNATCVKPRITDQPRSQVVNPGQSVTLAVAARGTTGFTYQWYEGTSPSTASPVSGAIYSTITTPPITATAKYWVRVTASCGTANSQTAILAVPSNLQGWGDNNAGEVGDGTTTDQHSPVGVLGPADFTQVAAGNDHSVGLRSDGTVWTWGNNGSGELGDGTQNMHTTPIQVPGLSSMTSVGAGNHWSLALKSDGTVWAWGANGDGQLGNNSTTMSKSPVQVLGLTGVTAISAGGYHALALKSNGTVWAWGDNYYGQCGDGGSTDRLTPVQATGITTATAVAGGGHHSLVLKSDQTVWAFGSNGSGQLGDNSTTTRRTPVQVSGLTGVSAVGAGDVHSLAAKAAGTAWAWGDNYYSQLGDGTTADKHIPVQVSTLTGVTAVAGGDKHSLAIKSDKTLWAWGTNTTGQLGDGSTTTRSTPVQVTAVSRVQAADAGYAHSLAVAFGVSIAATPAAGSVPLTVAFQASATGGTAPYTYAWVFGDGGVGSGASASHTYAAAGSYTAQVTATDSQGFTAAASTPITVANLQVTISASPSSPSGAPPLSVDFSSTVSGGTAPFTYAWSFGDGGVSAVADPAAYSYAVPGAYTASLWVMDSAGNVATSNSIPVSVVAPLMVSGSVKPARVLVGQSVAYRANVSGGSGYYTGYAWTFGDGGSGGGRSPAHTFSQAGTYSASVTVTDGSGATKTVSGIIVQVFGILSATATAPNWALKNNPITIQATVSGGDGRNSYAWDFGDGSSGTGATPSHTYTSTGPYTATVTVKDGMSQTATAMVAVNVVDPLAVSLSGPTTGPAGTPLTFTASATGGNGVYSYSWTFGDGGAGVGPSVSHTYATSNTYTVTVTAHDGSGQSASKSQNVLVGCTFTLATTSKNFTYKSGSTKVTVTGSGQTTCDRPVIYVSDSWVTATLVNFSSNKGKVKIAVTANPSATPRGAQVVIGGTVFTVTQDGAPCKVTAVSPAKITMAASGGTGSFSVTATAGACPWTATATGTAATWITMLQGSGTGPGTATFIVLPNTTGANRTGKISVAAGATKKTVTVVQSK